MSKINKLINEWPKGAIFTSLYLQKKGISNNLIYRYKKNHWVEQVGHSAYKLFNDSIEWFGAIYALQTQLGLSIHAGGKTALELKGYAHYLPQQLKKIFLYGVRGEKLPNWFKQYNWNLLYNYNATNLFSVLQLSMFSQFQYKDFTINISTPELAAMEMLYHVPGFQSFNEASLIIENLSTLRSGVVQELLKQCNSIKVKRLFMYMAEKHEHIWLNKLDLSKINFGSGKRVIVKNGKLDTKYNITVPAEYI